MSDHDLERRLMDEKFRRELAERLKGVEIGQQELKDDNKEIKDEIIKMKMAQLDLHYTLFGGPRADDQGLLEKFRKLLYRFGLALLIAVGAIAFAGKLIEPFYQKVVADWLYNSVSERWMREKAQPKVKHIHINIKQDRDDNGVTE